MGWAENDEKEFVHGWAGLYWSLIKELAKGLGEVVREESLFVSLKKVAIRGHLHLKNFQNTVTTFLEKYLIDGEINSCKTLCREAINLSFQKVDSHKDDLTFRHSDQIFHLISVILSKIGINGLWERLQSWVIKTFHEVEWPDEPVIEERHKEILHGKLFFRELYCISNRNLLIAPTVAQKEVKEN